MKDIITKHAFVIPTGTRFTEGPKRIEFHEPVYEGFLSAGKDDTIRVLVPKSVVEKSKVIDEVLQIIQQHLQE